MSRIKHRNNSKLGEEGVAPTASLGGPAVDLSDLIDGKQPLNLNKERMVLHD